MLSDIFDVILDENDITKDTIIIDDIIDTGKTFEAYPDNRKAALYGKAHSPEIDYVYAVKE
jgi:hypoxanthine-guanine phosphoribosyltransferase